MKSFKAISVTLMLVFIMDVLYAQPPIKIDWSVESTYFRETKATREQNAALRPPAKAGDKLYRYVTLSPNHSSLRQEFFRKHNPLTDDFRKNTPKTEQTALRFLAFAKSKDPYYAALIKKMAPQIRFEFIGQTDNYVLESIDINVLAYDEYSGGGIADSEEWYDIVLKHTPGKYSYPVKNKLKFNRTGEAHLRFWSDNFYPSGPMTPMGCYMIEIFFNFLDSKNTSISVSTGVFKIDV